jgi:pyruvate/2-oxoglutarate dehydrogenase complex dihydrolipoamide acyltransferase (E2) component
VRYLASSEPHEDGTRTVFFELNGQPRSVRVADRTQVLEHAPPRKAESGNASHVGAPMPGVVANITAAVGARVERGQLLLTQGDRDGDRRASGAEVAEVLVRAGRAVEARDLLVQSCSRPAARPRRTPAASWPQPCRFARARLRKFSAGNARSFRADRAARTARVLSAKLIGVSLN